MKKCLLYFNEKSGYYVVPQVRAKDVPVWLSVNPVEKVGLDSDTDLSQAIVRALECSETTDAPTLKEADRNDFWADLGFKNYGAFSKKHSAAQIESDGEKTSLTKLIRDNHGAYVKSTSNGDFQLLEASFESTELAIAAKKLLQAVGSADEPEERRITTLGQNIISYKLPNCDLEDCGNGGTDAYQVFKETDTDNYIAFLIDNGYRDLSENAIRIVLERQFGSFYAFSYDDSKDDKLVIKAENDACIIESNIIVFDDEFVEIQLFMNKTPSSEIIDYYHKVIESLRYVLN